MFIRKDYVDLMLKGGDLLLTHYVRAISLHLSFRGLSFPWIEEGMSYIPSCHHIAHAYAKAFNIEVVDGEYMSVRSYRSLWFRRLIPVFPTAEIHSWNVLRFDDCTSVILDIHPCQGSSLLPVLLQNPHPAYQIQTDDDFRGKMTKLKDEKFNLIVDELTRLFVQMAKED